MPPAAIEQFLGFAREAIAAGTLVKLTLGAYDGADPSLRNVFVRPVAVRAGLRLSFVYRHAARDLTANLAVEEGLSRIAELVANEFRTAHLFTTAQSVQLECPREGRARLIKGPPAHGGPADTRHDRPKRRRIDPAAPWLLGLGVTLPGGKVRASMSAKYRQVDRFAELLEHLLTQSPLRPGSALRLADMASGKGYLTFAAFDLLRRTGWPEAEALGTEARPDLVDLCNRVARESGFDRLRFQAARLADAPCPAADVLLALHACDTATDDALAKGIAAGAALILAAPCCHKELRPQLRAPDALAASLRHGVFRERQAEFVTDALRAALLEWAGYDTRVSEFIETEHTARNLMIAGVRRAEPGDRAEAARRVRELAAFYGIRSQRLATRLGFALGGETDAGSGPADRAPARGLTAPGQTA